MYLSGVPLAHIYDTPARALGKRSDIEHEVSALLKRGFTTTSAGGFFFIPYLLQLRAHDLVACLGPAKDHGIPKESLALGIIFGSIFGYKVGIRAVDSVSRVDFGLHAGLPFLPSISTQYRFLQAVSVQDGLDLQVKLGKQLVARGQVTSGFAVNIDGHNVLTNIDEKLERANVDPRIPWLGNRRLRFKFH